MIESANLQTGNDAFKDISENRSYSTKDGNLTDEMMVAVARDMAQKIANHFAEHHSRRNLVRRDKEVTLNRGEGGGVAVGDMFNAFALGAELVDPDTKEIVGPRRGESRHGENHAGEIRKPRWRRFWKTPALTRAPSCAKRRNRNSFSLKTLAGFNPGFHSLLLAAPAGLLATGCKTYQQKNQVIRYWHHGDLTNAVVAATKAGQKNANNKDAVIWRLEQGAVLRANGQFEDSNKAFDAAQEKMDDYAQKAKVRLGQETGALLSNQAELDYEGRAYDGIMLNTYKALNYLALGEPEKARPELIRAYQRQQDAVQDNQKRIEKVQDEAAKNKDSAAIKRAQNDPGLQSQIQNASANLNHLQGLCRLRQSVHRLSRRFVFHDRCRR